MLRGKNRGELSSRLLSRYHFSIPPLVLCSLVFLVVPNHAYTRIHTRARARKHASWRPFFNGVSNLHHHGSISTIFHHHTLPDFCNSAFFISGKFLFLIFGINNGGVNKCDGYHSSNNGKFSNYSLAKNIARGFLYFFSLPPFFFILLYFFFIFEINNRR